MSLSARGRTLIEGGFAPYLTAHHERQDDPGYVSLTIAENLGTFDLLRDRLQQFPEVPETVIGYADMAGREGLPEAIADLLATHLFQRPIDPAQVQVLSGASAVIDAVAHALGDPGDAVLVPVPSYAGFWPDLQKRAGLQVLPVPTQEADGFPVTPDDLERALRSTHDQVRMLLLTNPDNPRGQVLDRARVEAVLDWADTREVHVLADEVYGLSVFDGTPMPSVGQLRPQLGERLHVVWALSKDFGMSGLRVGVLISEHEQLREAIELQGIWGGVSAHTQHVVARMLEDSQWVEAYLSTMRRRLGEIAHAVSAQLTAGGVAHGHPSAGFFLLCDLRACLDAPTWEAEHRLWRRILETAQVNLTPGSALRAAEPGWFRLCYAANPADVVHGAVARVLAALRGR